MKKFETVINMCIKAGQEFTEIEMNNLLRDIQRNFQPIKEKSALDLIAGVLFDLGANYEQAGCEAQQIIDKLEEFNHQIIKVKEPTEKEIKELARKLFYMYYSNAKWQDSESVEDRWLYIARYVLESYQKIEGR